MRSGIDTGNWYDLGKFLQVGPGWRGVALLVISGAPLFLLTDHIFISLSHVFFHRLYCTLISYPTCHLQVLSLPEYQDIPLADVLNILTKNSLGKRLWPACRLGYLKSRLHLSSICSGSIQRQRGKLFFLLSHFAFWFNFKICKELQVPVWLESK